MSLSIYQEDLKSEQLIHNEAGFYKLLKLQGIILIAQLITVSHGSNSYQILLAWNPDMIIVFCEVAKGNGNVKIILESRLLTFMNKLWTNQRGFKCRNDPTHIIPPGCLLLRQEDAQKQIRDQCSLLLTAEGLDMDKLLNKRPTKWREGYAYVHVQGSRTAENVIHLLMKLYPGIKEPRTQQHNDNIMLAVKCYNLRRSEGSTLAQKYKDFETTLQELEMDPGDEEELPKLFTRCSYSCTGLQLDLMVARLYVAKYYYKENIENHENYFRYSMVNREDGEFIERLDRDELVDE